MSKSLYMLRRSPFLFIAPWKFHCIILSLLIWSMLRRREHALVLCVKIPKFWELWKVDGRGGVSLYRHDCVTLLWSKHSFGLIEREAMISCKYAEVFLELEFQTLTGRGQMRATEIRAFWSFWKCAGTRTVCRVIARATATHATGTWAALRADMTEPLALMALHDGRIVAVDNSGSPVDGYSVRMSCTFKG